MRPRCRFATRAGGVRMVYRPYWILTYLLCGILLLISQSILSASGITLAPVYWNSSNQLFKQSKNSHTIEVSLFDQIDFVCPYYSDLGDHANSSSYEYYTVYQVTRQVYEDCNMTQRDLAAMIVNCSNPLQHKRFTILFEMFQAIPNAPEFVPGSTYYYIATSIDRRDGLSNAYLGACDQLNMKLIIHVCCDTMTVESSAASQSPSSILTQFPGITWYSRFSRFSSSSHPEISVDINSVSLLPDTVLSNELYDTDGSSNANIPSQDWSNWKRISKTDKNDILPSHQGLINRCHGLHKTDRLLYLILLLWLQLSSTR